MRIAAFSLLPPDRILRDLYDDPMPTSAPNGGSYRDLYRRRWEISHRYVLSIAATLAALDFPVSPSAFLRPVWSETKRDDGGDLRVGRLIVEVKSHPWIFYDPDSFPTATVLLERVASWERKVDERIGVEPDLLLKISRRTLYAIGLPVRETKARWSVAETYDSTKRETVHNYYVDRDAFLPWRECVAWIGREIGGRGDA